MFLFLVILLFEKLFFMTIKVLSKLYFILIIFAIALLFSCSKEKNYPIIPVIEYKDFVYDFNTQKASLILGFTDGDGDVGLNSDYIYPPFDSASIYHYNFYVSIFEKINGNFVPFIVFNQSTQQNDTIIFKYRIPYIEPVSANGSLKGEFSTKMDIDLMLPYLHSDTVKFEAYIFDRKLHKSNIITTPIIIF